MICLIGPDGVGKSTQTRLLQKVLRSKGISADYVWIRWNHRFSLPVLALSKLLRISAGETLPTGKKVVYHYFNRIRPIALVYQLTFLIDTMLGLLFKIYPKIWAGKLVISDRSVYDSFIDLVLSTRNPQLLDLDSFFARVFLAFARGTTVMLMANSNVLKARREDVSKDRDIDQKIQLYNLLSTRCGIKKVDTEKSIAEVHSAIMRIVMPP